MSDVLALEIPRIRCNYAFLGSRIVVALLPELSECQVSTSEDPGLRSSYLLFALLRCAWSTS
jgi:hypothetical protein